MCMTLCEWSGSHPRGRLSSFLRCGSSFQTVPRHYCVRIRFVDVRAGAPSFYTRWATRSGCSARSDQPSPPVEISCLSISHCITSLAARRGSILDLSRSTRKASRHPRSSCPHSGHGDRQLPLGRAADPRGVAEARHHRVRTNGVAVSARTTEGSFTDLAHVLDQPAPPADGHPDDRVIGRTTHRRRCVPVAGSPDGATSVRAIHGPSACRKPLAFLARKRVSRLAERPRPCPSPVADRLRQSSANACEPLRSLRRLQRFGPNSRPRPRIRLGRDSSVRTLSVGLKSGPRRVRTCSHRGSTAQSISHAGPNFGEAQAIERSLPSITRARGKAYPAPLPSVPDDYDQTSETPSASVWTHAARTRTPHSRREQGCGVSVGVTQAQTITRVLETHGGAGSRRIDACRSPISFQRPAHF